MNSYTNQGFGEHVAVYEHVAKRLSLSNFTIFTYDQRGYGQSGGRKAHLDSIERALLDLKEIIDQCVFQNPVYLYGHGSGATLCLWYGIYLNRLQAILGKSDNPSDKASPVKDAPTSKVTKMNAANDTTDTKRNTTTTSSTSIDTSTNVSSHNSKSESSSSISSLNSLDSLRTISTKESSSLVQPSLTLSSSSSSSSSSLLPNSSNSLQTFPSNANSKLSTKSSSFSSTYGLKKQKTTISTFKDLCLPPVGGMVVQAPYIRLATQIPKWQKGIISLISKAYGGYTINAEMSTQMLTTDVEMQKFLRENRSFDISAKHLMHYENGSEKLVENAYRFRHPILLLHGQADVVNDPNYSQLFISKCSSLDKEFVLLYGMRHDLHHEKDRETMVFKKIIQWLHSSHRMNIMDGEDHFTCDNVQGKSSNASTNAKFSVEGLIPTKASKDNQTIGGSGPRSEATVNSVSMSSPFSSPASSFRDSLIMSSFTEDIVPVISTDSIQNHPNANLITNINTNAVSTSENNTSPRQLMEYVDTELRAESQMYEKYNMSDCVELDDVRDCKNHETQDK